MSRNYKFHNPEGLYFVSFIEPREVIRAVAGAQACKRLITPTTLGAG